MFIHREMALRSSFGLCPFGTNVNPVVGAPGQHHLPPGVSDHRESCNEGGTVLVRCFRPNLSSQLAAAWGLTGGCWPVGGGMVLPTEASASAQRRLTRGWVQGTTHRGVRLRISRPGEGVSGERRPKRRSDHTTVRRAKPTSHAVEVMTRAVL